MISWRNGETMACDYLREQGYTILARNYRCKRGEIDIIAVQNSLLVCAEVKTWSRVEMDGIEYSIDYKKQRASLAACKIFLLKNPEHAESMVRFDVIFIDADSGVLRHIEDAFTESGVI